MEDDPAIEFLDLETWPVSPPRVFGSGAAFVSSSEASASASASSTLSPSPQSQDSPADTYFVGFILAYVKGIQYYNGAVHGREMVGLVRDPLNRYDENAIKVVNIRSVQVGNIDKAAARVLAPMMDTQLINVAGIVPNGSKSNRYQLPCQVHIFARQEAFDDVKSAVSDGGFQLMSESSSSSFALSQSDVTKRKLNGEGEKSVDEIFKLLDEQIAEAGVLGELEPPRDVIKSELLSHQKAGLAWLVHRENSCDLPPFWESKDGAYYNVLTNHLINERPEPLRGGIFADDMGLGKTLTLLSLIAFDKFFGDCSRLDDSANAGNASSMGEKETTTVRLNKRKRERGRHTCNPEKTQRTGELEVSNNSRKTVSETSKYACSTSDTKQRSLCNSNNSLNTCPRIGTKGKTVCDSDSLNDVCSETTLVVCPPSVFSAWVTQLEDHIAPGKLKVYMYYGDRTKDANKLLEYDIVLTTYSTLATEDAWEESPLKKIEWRRVILDEAHLIKNVKARQSQAVTNLKSKRRWVVTGTPIQNSSLDLFSLLAFLKFEPLSVKSYWDSLIAKPLASREEKGISRLQVLMATIALRRTKDKTLIGLPSKSVETLVIDLSEEERDVYDKMESEARKIIKNYLSAEKLVRNYSTVLSILVRLRQLCNALALCPPEIRDLLPSLEDVKNNPKLLEKMLSVLQEGEDFDCPICICAPTNPVITCCAHIFCQACILKAIRRSTAGCPLCRHPLSDSDLFSAPPKLFEAEEALGSSSSSSSKIAVLLKRLCETREQNPTTKSVIFSQFRKMLLLVEEPLKAAGFKILMLDGSMNANKRAKIIKEFDVPAPGGPTILLASLRASGAGINLTAASRVYLLEPWWNPAIEEQAMDRVHRIGQKEDVQIVRIIARNTIEERILELQAKKALLAKKAFGKGIQGQREISKEDLITLMHL
ncbi:OLC1v1036384C1 [Oldenlandia corymbosa var. corymbosa]|uniref:OLC1v1036384C1 n=1 Tax=Oldenlandia corymbosa var. corymbosa TaxID=529605 RepID=A0AAV1CV63_OLDCO|nr:OLC1v1036384C1 [Oldenlandia corymbosa var. corymbosa]